MESFPSRRHLRPTSSSSRYHVPTAVGSPLRTSPTFQPHFNSGGTTSDYGHNSNNSYISSANSSSSASSSPSASSNSLLYQGNSVMPVTSNTSLPQRSRIAGGGGRFSGGPVRDLQEKMNEMNKITAPGVKQPQQTMMTMSTESTSSKFNRSVSSSAGLRIPSQHNLRRHETSPAIVELPSHSPTDSLDENGSVGGGSSQHAYPIVTSPVTDIAELAAQSGVAGDLHLSDPESTSGGLTSPNLVTSTGLPLSNSLPVVAAAAGLSRLNSLGLQPTSSAAAAAAVASLSPATSTAVAAVGAGANSSSLFSREERKTSTSSKTKIGTDGAISKKATATDTQMMRVQAGDISYEENSATSASKARLETAEGTVAEQTSGMKHRSKSVVAGNMMHRESNLATMSGSTVKSGNFLSQNVSEAHSSSVTSSSMSAGGKFTHQQSSHRASKMSVTRSSSLLTAHQIHEMMNTKANLSIEELRTGLNHFDDLECLTPNTQINNVQNALVKYCGIMSSTVEAMKKDGHEGKADSLSDWMSKINDMMAKAWEVPSFGHEIGNTLCDILRNNGGLDLLIENCVSDHPDLQYQSARLLQQCLVTENRGYVVEKGLDKVVEVAKNYTTDIRNIRRSRVGTGILEHLFKHSESTCGDVISMGGLDTVVNECKSTDVDTLRHCAGALANVAMYGGAENQEAMINRKVPIWLFPLAFHSDDTVKYYACLAIAALVANKEIEAAVQKSGTLDLIEPFVQTHSPSEFAHKTATHSHGQSPNWLKRLIPVLMSHREEARNLAAFHFCMEAEIKKQQGKLELFSEIGAIESLKKVASCPNGIASKYAAQTLRLIGEEVPHKLSQQVPTWSVEDVKEWVKQIGFAKFADSFAESRVDGDLLLQLTEDMLQQDISMRNGILRRRFLRELIKLKRMADYSSCDPSNLNDFLQSLGPEYSVYTYDMINAGIDRDTLMNINDEQLLSECGISNKIHRLKIQQGVKVERGDFSITDEASLEKNLDVFISYRRSNGSQLASLLKVHLEIRNFSVFLDVAIDGTGLESGKFDYNLLQSIRSARNFVLVLTPSALDRCFNDHEQRDWIHKEVACALQSNCNVIPVFDNFVMPDPKLLPESMRAVTSYNGVKWIHDYQDACVDKIDRFIRGEAYGGLMDRFLNSQPSVAGSAYGSSTQGTFNRQNSAYVRNISQDNSSACSDDANQNSSSSARDI